MHLSILPENSNIENLYRDHSTYHDKIGGLDLFFIEETNIVAKSTKLDLEVQMQFIPMLSKT